MFFWIRGEGAGRGFWQYPKASEMTIASFYPYCMNSACWGWGTPEILYVHIFSGFVGTKYHLRCNVFEREL